MSTGVGVGSSRKSSMFRKAPFDPWHVMRASQYCVPVGGLSCQSCVMRHCTLFVKCFLARVTKGKILGLLHPGVDRVYPLCRKNPFFHLFSKVKIP